jgi:hypothetical protein
MVQRLANIGKVYEKDRKEKKVKHVAVVKKRQAKENEKRQAKQKELRKERYQKAERKKGKNKEE